MCIQWDDVYECGHRAFREFVPCAEFGRTCLGNNGEHSDWPAPGTCHDCISRSWDPNPEGRANDPYVLAAQQRAEQQQLVAQQLVQDQERQRQEAASRRKLQRQQQQNLAQMIAQGQGSFQRVPGQGVQWVPEPQIQGSSQAHAQPLQWQPIQSPQAQGQGQDQGAEKEKGKGKGKAKGF